MIQFVHVVKDYSIGISYVGILAFIMQEIPYLIMPFLKLESNPIMNLQHEAKGIEVAQTICGIFTILMLIFLVREDAVLFPLESTRETFFFSLMLILFFINFTGWTVYFRRYHISWLIVSSQFAAVPLYYFCFGMWKQNLPLAWVAIVFFILHTVNGYMNFIGTN